MAQFVPQQQYMGQPQPQMFQSMQQQAPVQVQNRFHGESDTLLRKENTLALKLKSYLFYVPFLFFLVLLAFSIAIYCLRFEKDNGTTNLASQVLFNYGTDLSTNPIIDVQLLAKVNANSVENTCSDLKDADIGKGNQALYTQVNFANFSAINSGCVCLNTAYGKNQLTYHESDYCDITTASTCKSSSSVPQQSENVFAQSIWCIRRSVDFLFKLNSDTTTCASKGPDINGNDFRACGNSLCVSAEINTMADSDKQKTFAIDNFNCPITRIQFSKSQASGQYYIATNTAKIATKLQLKSQTLAANNKKSEYRKLPTQASTTLQNFAGYYVFLDRAVYPTDLPVIGLRTSISNPSCLSSDLQRPMRQSKKTYKLQDVQELGCLPYLAHKANLVPNKPSIAISETNADYLESFVGVVTQASYYDTNNNAIDYSTIPYYNDIVEPQDFVNLYAQIRPNILLEKDECHSDQIKFAAQKSKEIVKILNFVGDYSLVLIIVSAVGLFFSFLFIALKSNNIVNHTTQLYLHILTMLVAIAVFVYPLVFWAYLDEHNSAKVEQQLNLYVESSCFMYAGQTTAATYLHSLIEEINNSIFGLTTFLFVFAALYIISVLVAAFLRKKEHLNICEPVKGEQLYYE